MLILKRLIQISHAFATDVPLGDIVVLKFSMFTTPAKNSNPKLQKYRGQASSISRSDLDKLPPDTFGHEYGRHLTSNNIEHLAISPSILRQFEDNPYAIRYTQTHDFHHVLLGFDTSVAGELGVAAFTAQQGLGPLSVRALQVLRWIYPLFVPSQFRAIQNNIDLGLAMGKKAKFLIAEPLEDKLHEPLEKLRQSVGISMQDIVAVKKGGGSILVATVYRLFGR